MTCKHGTPFERFCDLCKSECFTVPPKPALVPGSASIPAIRANLACAARNEAMALTYEIENEADARLAVVRAMTEALRDVTAEWGAAGWLPEVDRLP